MNPSETAATIHQRLNQWTESVGKWIHPCNFATNSSHCFTYRNQNFKLLYIKLIYLIYQNHLWHSISTSKILSGSFWHFDRDHYSFIETQSWLKMGLSEPSFLLVVSCMLQYQSGKGLRMCVYWFECNCNCKLTFEKKTQLLMFVTEAPTSTVKI